MADNVYYSISPFGTGDIKTGSPTLTISSGVATISVAQTGNIGIGCRITYDTTSIAYISAVNSSTSFDVVTAVGGTPSDEGSAVTVNSIAHEYASLSAFEAGFTDANHINNASLVAADVLVHACCYYDHDDQTVDSGTLDFDWGGTTDGTRKLIMLAPGGGTESINIQHSETGIFDTDKYYLKLPNRFAVGDIDEDYIDFVNIQVESTVTASAGGGTIAEIDGAGTINFDDCILKGDINGSFRTDRIVWIVNASNTTNLTNCILTNANFNGIGDNFVACTVAMDNCTVYNITSKAVERNSSTFNVKNTLSFNNGTDFDGSFTSITYCASDDSKAGTGNFQITQTALNYAALVTDAVNGDFSVTDSSSELYNAGTNTGAPATDIIGTSRPQETTVDIGAFELASASGVTVNSTLGTVAVTGVNPSISEGIDIDSTLGTVAIAGINPAVSPVVNIDSTLGALVVAGFNPSISEGIDIDSTLGAVTISGINPDVSLGTDIASTLGAATIAGINPTVSAGTTIDSTLGTVAISGINPLVDLGLTIYPNVGEVVIAGINPAISEGIDIDSTLGAVVIAGNNTVVALPTDIDSTLGQIAIAGINPAIGATVSVQPNVGLLAILGYNPTVTAETEVDTPDSRAYIVRSENRVHSVQYEDRTHIVI